MTVQGDLFAPTPRRAAQREEITRVRAGIGGSVMAFCRHVGIGGQFHAADLHAWVQQHSGRAPASADRILRLLRTEQRVGYVVIDRSASLYRITALADDREARAARAAHD